MEWGGWWQPKGPVEMIKHQIPTSMGPKAGKYRHSKSGKLYQVLGLGKHSETLEDVVIYGPLYESEVRYWVRPVTMWEEEVMVEGKKRKRFEKIDN